MEYNVLLAAILVTFSYVPTSIGMESQNCNDCPNFGEFLSCDPQTCDWLLLNGYWAGNITEGGDTLIGLCPLGYCLYNASSKVIWIPRNATQMISNFLCNETHRMGVLCGQCQPGYAAAIISSYSYATECVPCDAHSSKVNWIYYLLAIYVPLLVVFLVIIVFNIRLTTGPLNSFILFAQVISTTVDINLQGLAPLNLVYGLGTSAFEKSYEIPYNLFNLNLFTTFLWPFCLHERLETLDVIALRYIEGFFPVIIIIVIILLLRCQRSTKLLTKVGVTLRLCLCCKYQVGASLSHAFAAFVLLSYNRLCETTVYLLGPTPLFNQSHQATDGRVYFQGNYLTTDHIFAVRYKLPAYLVTAFLILVPITLLHYPVMWMERLISRVGCLRNAYPTTSIAILLDTFQGCFKDNRRYFAGLYLALRLLLFFAFLLQPLQQLLTQQVIFIVYIFLVSFFKPYKDSWINSLDTAMFINMAFINGLSWYVNSAAETDPPAPLVTCIILESILVFVPMVYFVAYLLWYNSRCYRDGVKTKMVEWCHKGSLGKSRSTGHDDMHPNSYQTIDDSEFDALFERQKEQLDYDSC